MSTLGVSSAGPTVRLRPGRSTAWWGMVGLMVTEAMLFGLLLFTYFYFRAQPGEWPPGALPMPELTASGVRSVLLIGSSLPMVLAERSLEEEGTRARSVVWMLITLAMAAVFLIGHVQEQLVLWTELAPTETAYGSVMMTILNFHALHLIIGMVVLAFVLVHTMRGAVTRERPTQLRMAGLYWHFVDAIWVLVYASLYLSPHLLG